MLWHSGARWVPLVHLAGRLEWARLPRPPRPVASSEDEATRESPGMGLTGF